MDALRFTIVAIGGVTLDLTIAYALARGFGLPLWLAAMTGFLVAALVNYVLHELWTFGAAGRRVSARRAFKYVFVSILTLAARIGIVFLLGTWFGTTPALPILIAGAGVSFLVNFALSKFVVFTKNASADTVTK